MVELKKSVGDNRPFHKLEKGAEENVAHSDDSPGTSSALDNLLLADQLDLLADFSYFRFYLHLHESLDACVGRVNVFSGLFSHPFTHL